MPANSLLDFLDPVSKDIDWDAYRESCIAAGRMCQECGGYIYAGEAKRQTCRQCRNLAAGVDTRHPLLVQCPGCRRRFQPDRQELLDRHIQKWRPVGYAGGGVEVVCPQCERAFPVRVWVTVEFESPDLPAEIAECPSPS